MVSYNNRNGNSGILSYEIGQDYIKIKFRRTLKIYVYSYKRAGEFHIERMKNLARDGVGLNSYINTYVRNLYD